jgi:DNA polymerase III epsilon subunit-like protein
METKTINILEVERRLEKTSSIIKTYPNSSEPVKSKFWVGWYLVNGSDEYRIVLPTLSTSKESAEEKINKIITEGERGVGELLPNLKVIVPMPKKDKNEDQEDLKLPDSILKHVQKNIVKNASYITEIDISDFIILDTETTGLFNSDEIVELAAIRFIDGKYESKFHRYIIPTVPIHPQAQKAHGLTIEFLKENGVPASQAFKEFLEWKGDYPICGHNIQFDKRMIENHFKKLRMKIEIKKGFCTLELSKKIMQLPSHKLENIIDIFDIRKGLGSHNAMDDVKATARYASILNKVYKYACRKATEN